jgi:hypothetical protein
MFCSEMPDFKIVNSNNSTVWLDFLPCFFKLPVLYTRVVNIGTIGQKKVPLRIVVCLSKVTKLAEKNILNQLLFGSFTIQGPTIFFSQDELHAGIKRRSSIQHINLP